MSTIVSLNQRPSTTTTGTNSSRSTAGNPFSDDTNIYYKKKAIENCKLFLYYLDNGKGYEKCKPYCTDDDDDARFDSQCETLKNIKTVEEYANWVCDIVKLFPGFVIDVHNCSFCEENKTVVYAATFHGKHTVGGGADGSPAATPTQKEMHTDYTYVVKLNNDDKVESVKKVWNDTWALRQVGWVV